MTLGFQSQQDGLHIFEDVASDAKGFRKGAPHDRDIDARRAGFEAGKGSVDVERIEKGVGAGGGHTIRSEEHTSELQSLMRISYAVFCLKKKNNTTTQQS